MGGLSGWTKLQSRHVLRAQCWPDGCRTFAFCRTDRPSLLSYECLWVGILIAKTQIEFSMAYRWNRITTRAKMDIHPPKNVRRGVPKGGMASTQGEACPRQSINGGSALHSLDAPLNQVNQARTLLSKGCGIRLRGSIGTELQRSKAG